MNRDKEAVGIEFKTLCRDLLGMTEEIHGKDMKIGL
jgi:hypothetical protein